MTIDELQTRINELVTDMMREGIDGFVVYFPDTVPDSPLITPHCCSTRDHDTTEKFLDAMHEGRLMKRKFQRGDRA